jgi:phytoene/squalene synthetase
VRLTASSPTGGAIDQPEGLAPDQSTLAPGLRLLPTGARSDVYRLYDVLRKLDDLVDDEQPEAAQRLDAVEAWTRGEPTDTYETHILTDLAQRHALPKHALLQFCQGMRHDIARTVIHTEEDLELYAQRAGGSVGIMLARLLGSAHPEAETKMATLGRATQRTNILRDIDEDATQNRLYIAQSTIERFGGPTPGGRAELIRDQIARADALYEQAKDATSMLASGQRAMALCATLYREILRQIERTGYGQNTGRVVVPVWRRRLLIARHHLRLDTRPAPPTRAQA